jgi:hypothetical protein
MADVTNLPTDTATLVSDVKAAASKLSGDAQDAFKQFLADAHQEVADATGAASTIWSQLLAAIHGTTPAAVQAGK